MSFRSVVWIGALVLGCAACVGDEAASPPLADFDGGGKNDLPGFGTARAAYTDWMGSLADGRLLSAVSIPGTHDSGARVEPWAGTAKTQDYSIAEQLNMGVRFLDIRCRHLNDSFVIHHGSVYQRLNFDDVLRACTDFLSSHPTETILMSIRDEYDPQGNTRTFEDTFEAYVRKDPGKWYGGAAVPTLGQARGKIVLMRRFAAQRLPKGIDATGWADNRTFTIDTGSASLRIQDSYNVSSNDAKWDSITSLLRERASANLDALYINFTSGVKSILGVPSITAVSKDINSRLWNYFHANPSGQLGIVAMDFADAARCGQVVDSNF